MSLRVDKPQAQGQRREGQQSWDLGHKKKKQRMNQTPYQTDTCAEVEENGTIYNSKGDLVPLASCLKMSI
jgi:hypothetical protein